MLDAAAYTKITLDNRSIGLMRSSQERVNRPIQKYRSTTERFPCDDPRKILHGGQRMAKLHNGVETLPKIPTG